MCEESWLKEDEVAAYCGWVDAQGNLRVSCVMPTEAALKRIWKEMPPPSEEERQAWLDLKPKGDVVNKQTA